MDREKALSMLRLWGMGVEPSDLILSTLSLEIEPALKIYIYRSTGSRGLHVVYKTNQRVPSDDDSAISVWHRIGATETFAGACWLALKHLGEET